MFETINWNWSFVGVAGLFFLSAMITAGTQIQIRNAVAFGKIPVQGTNTTISILGVSKWLSILGAVAVMVFMLFGYRFNTMLWWFAVLWLLFNMSRGNNVVKITTQPSTRMETAGPVQWQVALMQKAATDPEIRKSLAEIMWLDQFLMTTIKENPRGEIPEMQSAWSLCVLVAQKLGIPEQEGADWLSYHASTIGSQLGIEPMKPISKVISL